MADPKLAMAHGGGGVFFFFLKKRKKKLTGIIMASQIKKWLKATPYEVEVT
jgi:hypothetical protein